MLKSWVESTMSVISTLFDVASPFRTPALVITTIITLWVVYKVITKAIRRYVKARAFKPENTQNFLLLWRYLWMTMSVILVLVSFSGSIAGLGISAAFMGMILGWSLQAPVTGIAAWLMVILKRPFKIGDRIIVAGITGDVLDITLTHILLNQVGGTIGGEEKSGRGVLIPNATLFSQTIYNYTLETPYLLDEEMVVMTFESDVDVAESIMLTAASEVTKDIVAITGQEPSVRLELVDWGLRLRLRYQTPATNREKTSSKIARLVFDGFMASDAVEFSYPHTEIVYRGTQSTPRPGAKL